MSLSKELASVKFVPVDRINTLIAVAPNPGVYDQIEEWIKKLDVKVKVAAGKTDTYVYRVKYGEATKLAQSIMMLYLSAYGMGGYGMGGYGMGGYGMGGYGMGGYGMGGFGMGGYGMGGYGTGGYGMGGATGANGVSGVAGTAPGAPGTALTGMATPGQPYPGGDMTGSYMGSGMGMGGYGMMMKGPRVVANQTDNSLMILATPEEYDSVLKLIEQLDIPPRQVLVEAKIYEVKLGGSLSWGLEYYLQNQASGSSHSVSGKVTSSALGLSSGWMVNHAKELMATLSTGEVSTRTKVISMPSVVATDSIAASITVGTEIPTLTSSATSSASVSGSSLYASTISMRQTGVTLSFTARVNPTGIVTLQISQEVSSPTATTYGVTSSASISNRNISTQLTMQDGDTVAIGGIISESDTWGSSGVPFLQKIPLLGMAFGSKTASKERTEMVVFLTPRVIFDSNELVDASEELMSKMKRVQKLMR
jgi:general secretion pathway protein D